MDNAELKTRAVRALMQADKAHRSALEAGMSDVPIHRSQHMLLMFLSRRGDMPTQIEIARELNITPASVASLLDKLEKTGFVKRVQTPDNRRENRVQLTDEGRALAAETRVRFGRVDNIMCEGLTDDELILLSSCLDRMSRNLSSFGARTEDKK